MQKKVFVGLFVMFALVAAVGCATKQPVQPIKVQTMGSNAYLPAADNILIILDASSSMADLHQTHAKYDIAVETIEGLIKSIPGMNIDAGLLSFGHDTMVSREPVMVLSPLNRFNQTNLQNGLKKVSVPGGLSNLNKAIDDASNLLKGKSGKKALIIISDGEDMGDLPLMSAKQMQKANNYDVCIHSIQVGSGPQGAMLLRSLAATNACGSYSNADNLQSGAQLAGFVSEYLIKEDVDSDGDGVLDSKDKCADTPSGVKVDNMGCPMDSDKDGVFDGMDRCPQTPAGVAVDKYGCPQDDDGDGVFNAKDMCPRTPANVKVDAKGCPVDSDRDGVADYMDQCPGTAFGMTVDRIGCPIPTTSGVKVTEAGNWVFEGIQFESGKAELKSGSRASLDEIVKIMKENPQLKLEIQGHTDSSGNVNYNYRLSESRALAVKEYLVNHGVSTNRLTSKGYGPSKPMADNATSQGRALNRRVEFNPF